MVALSTAGKVGVFKVGKVAIPAQADVTMASVDGVIAATPAFVKLQYALKVTQTF